MNRKINLWIIAAGIIAIALFALTTPASALKKSIDGRELTQLQSAGAWVIDVRANGEYITGHIPNSLNLPLDQLKQAAATWDKNQPIVVYCATGARSAEAAFYLASQGFTKVYNLDKGIAAWTGQLAGGQAATAIPTGAGVVKTSGKPVFIDFASST
jgi:rhodanese-related sulfurtransferase